MFPCCGWPRSSGSYIYLPHDETDSDEEIELQTVSVTSGLGQGIPPPSLESEGDSDIEFPLTEESIIHTEAAYQGVLSPLEGIGITSMGYSLLRLCDYIQLCIADFFGFQSPLPLSRERRDRVDRTSLNVTNATIPINRSSNHTVVSVPQWVYPCGITPNGTFPGDGRPFRVFNITTGQYELLLSLDYGTYFRGGFDELANSYSETRKPLLVTEPLSHLYLVMPYGFRGTGSWIFRDIRGTTPYASYGISNALVDNGTCPVRIFNATHFFGGGYLGLEEPGFERIYPCGIHPDGLFTGEWLAFPNGTIPEEAYPFGYFPNRTFPYLDYFFNPQFNHSELYLAVQNNQSDALQNYTRFLNPNETRVNYHHIPVNYTQPFSHCYEIPRRPSSSRRRLYPVYDDNTVRRQENMNRNVIRAELWFAQFGAELGVIVLQNTSYARRRVVHALYLGARTANIIHSAVDLISNVFHIIQHGPTDGEGEMALRNMLTLTDVLALTNEAVYFCTPALQRMQERLTEGRVAFCFSRLCFTLQRANRVVRGALNRAAAVAGAIGVTCAAGLGAGLTLEFISNEDTADRAAQGIILGVQITVAAVAATALAWMTRANLRRARIWEE